MAFVIDAEVAVPESGKPFVQLAAVFQLPVAVLLVQIAVCAWSIGLDPSNAKASRRLLMGLNIFMDTL